jgi:pimeloyl-ACP methyl ester carboxylesterase
MNEDILLEQDQQLRENLRGMFNSLGGTVSKSGAQVKTGHGRYASRFGPGRISNPPRVMNLLRRNGALEWDFGFGLRSPQGKRRAASRFAAGREGVEMEIVEQVVFEDLPPNQVTTAINKVDRWLTARAWEGKETQPSGLRKIVQNASGDWTLGDLWRDTGGLKNKKVFLFVHGTASNCDKCLQDLQFSREGQALLAKIATGYDHVLGFDHPTLGTSPLLNALDLHRQMELVRGLPKSVDIVTHSRGGIVTRWFAEQLCPADMALRMVLVGAPISGTSLAAPANIKRLLDLLTNIGHVTAKGFGAAPFLQFAAALVEVMSAAVSLVAHTPVPDVLLNLLPGLAAQQRVGNNSELLRLRRPAGALRDYYALTADFAPEDIGWNFLKLFRKPATRLLDSAADYLFQGPNDLVVDTASMTKLADLADIPKAAVKHFKGDSVHHCNYFTQPPTCAFISKSLGIQ